MAFQIPSQSHRFIPAGAGNTPDMNLNPEFQPVYPRGCGEHTLMVPSENPFNAFIPAGAGNTYDYQLCHRSFSVYPRGCGEHEHHRRTQQFSFGLSPRVRGTPISETIALYPVRFIPAGAGNTWIKTNKKNGKPVYPRGCGEHHLSGNVNRDFTGLSPRVRGTLGYIDESDMYDRFIPAGAGNTFFASLSSPLSSVYPRGCGEHICGIS